MVKEISPSVANRRFLSKYLKDPEWVNALRKASAKTWWDEFQLADEAGVIFSLGPDEDSSVYAEWEGATTSSGSISDVIEEIGWKVKGDELEYPERNALRAAGWRCKVVSGGFAYLKRGEVVRALFVTPNAAWDDLQRSMP